MSDWVWALDGDDDLINVLGGQKITIDSDAVGSGWQINLYLPEQRFRPVANFGWWDDRDDAVAALEKLASVLGSETGQGLRA